VVAPEQPEGPFLTWTLPKASCGPRRALLPCGGEGRAAGIVAAPGKESQINFCRIHVNSFIILLSFKLFSFSIAVLLI
jgi:hypothetical protein